jgi:hypothetical protein
MVLVDKEVSRLRRGQKLLAFMARVIGSNFESSFYGNRYS